MIIKYLGMNEKQYRKLLSLNRKVVEQQLSNKEFNKIDYEKVPSQASLKYRKAFERNDKERYTSFVDSVIDGSKTLNTKTLSSYQTTLIASNENSTQLEEKLAEVAFKNILNELDDIDSNTIVVRDGSGSMYCNGEKINPIDIANALTLTCAAKLKGSMHNSFITYSSKAKFVTIPEELSLKQKIKFLSSFGDYDSTNITDVYNLIYELAKKAKDLESIPKRIIIISDMEFDPVNFNCSSPSLSTLLEFKNKYNSLGLELPMIYYWCVANRNNTVPVISTNESVYAISGYSQHILNSIIKNEKLDPMLLVEQVLEKYSFVDKFVL
jgi:hypothetical protein